MAGLIRMSLASFNNSTPSSNPSALPSVTVSTLNGGAGRQPDRDRNRRRTGAMRASAAAGTPGRNGRRFKPGRICLEGHLSGKSRKRHKNNLCRHDKIIEQSAAFPYRTREVRR
ncbi:MAG: hypothetical protein OXC11_00325 [Rhodospirillales bacterium]|nr:hypothetical protein [Rhodospirillales bacterium]